jgi:uncharacterized protein YceK
MLIYRSFFLAFAVLFVAGCAAVTSFLESDAARPVIRIGTVQWIGDDAERARRLDAGIAQLRATIDVNPEVTVLQIEQLATQIIIAADDMSPALRVSMLEFIAWLGDQLRGKVASDEIANETVLVSKVLQWISEGVALSGVGSSFGV